ncbi:MAG TPA: HEAT repeat domain-containing protein, partial [Fodinibius sp.]|nr:HEAT repeat domain-containing protein [Fodinibius sp.]
YQDTKINIAVKQSLADSIDSAQLLQQAGDWMPEIEKKMQTDYPFGNLTIVVLEDHNWETKSWGASTIYLYKNRGSLQHQLLRGLTGQWASARSLPAQWKQADAVTLYQTLLLQSVTDEINDLKVASQPQPAFDTVYEQFGPIRWNAWQKQWQEWQQQSAGLFANLPPELTGEFLLKLGGSEYLEYWENGPLFQLSTQESRQDSAEREPAEKSALYEVTYAYNETGGDLSLSFNAVEGGIDGPVQLSLSKVYGGQTDRMDINFSGQRDSVTVSVNAGLRSAWLTVPEGLNLKLDEHKPVPFLLYQMRNAETVQQRARAARGLGEHTDNPDIQLAVDDALSGNIEPEVRAGLLAALADITDGATGTQQTFLKVLQSDEKVVRRAGLYGLQNYPENDEVQSRIRNFAANVEDSTLFGEAILAYADFVPADEFKSFLLETTGRDSTGRRALTAVRYLSDTGRDTTFTTDLLSPFLNADYPFKIRRRALQGLTTYDESPENWLARGKKALAESADPRIRYLVAKGMLKNSFSEIQSFLENYLPTEDDARVYRFIETETNQSHIQEIESLTRESP